MFGDGYAPDERIAVPALAGVEGYPDVGEPFADLPQVFKNI